jgi:hypothetical protein
MTLSKQVLEAQQSIVHLLSSMFLGLGELEIDEDSQTVLATLAEYLDAPDTFDSVPVLSNAHITIYLSVADSKTVTLSIVLHLRSANPESRSPPLLELSIKHPSWLSRTSYERLVSSLPSYTGSSALDVQGAEDGRDWLMQVIEHLDSESTKHMLTESTTSPCSPVPAPPTTPPEITRVWFYLPSLSTREKRTDMITLASKHALTGFVLAGKPGLLCIEAPDRTAPDAYIAELKTVSWADIPPHQKKITERYREVGLRARAFEDMREVTEIISTRGARANRGDMGEVRAFLEDKGLKGVLEIVLGAEFK